MSTAIQRRRGTTAEHSAFTGLVGELTVDTDKKAVVVHDGSTAGGFQVPTLAGTETFTNKTLTNPDINGGTVDGATIGGSSAGAGTFTTLTATGATALSGTLTETINQNGETKINVTNTTAGTGASAIFNATNNASKTFQAGMLSSANTFGGAYPQGGAYVSTNGPGGLSIFASDSAGDVRIYAGGAAAGDLVATFSDDQTTTFTGPIFLKSYTVGTLPAASTAAGLIYVSDETGGAIPCFSDGTNWRRVSDRSIAA